MAKCDVCKTAETSNYCSFCKAYICSECIYDPKGRLTAFMGRKGLSVEKFKKWLRSH